MKDERVKRAIGPTPWVAKADRAYGMESTRMGDPYVVDGDGQRVCTTKTENHAIAIAAAVNEYVEG